ncbi:MAG: carboxypeptidase-like regulatory domain-containing protein, partial [Nitrospira sp.]
MYSCVKGALNAIFVTIVVAVVGGMCSVLQAADSEQAQTIKGVVQQQDLRRVPQAIIEVKNQAGDMVSSGVSNDAGEFKVAVPEGGTYSVSAVQETYRSEYMVLMLGEEPVNPVTLTLSKTKEVSLEVVAPLPPINTKASSETYSLSRKEIDILPRGNNNDLHDVLLTIPGAAYGSLKQLHIRQDHANLQLRIDGVPIPETVSATFSDVISPRAWER